MSIVTDAGSPLQPQLDISKTTGVVCKCGNHTFVHGVFLREISAIASPTGKGGIIPIPTFTCNACGAVPDAVVPPFLKAESRSSVAQVITDAAPAAATPTFEKSSLTLLKD
jgi:hypothetical protein